MKKRTITKGIGLTIVFAFMLLFAMVANTSECNAENTKGTVTIHIYCGSGHEATAESITTYLNAMGIGYNDVTATRSGSTINVACQDSTTVDQTIKAVVNAIDNHFSGPNIENNEFMSLHQIGLHPVGYYSSYADFFYEYFDYKDESVNSHRDFYLLWKQPYTKNIAIEIDVPICGTIGSEEGPSVRCVSDSQMAFPFSPATSSDSTEYPVWFAGKPDKSALSNNDFRWVYKYNDILNGGIRYYACAKFEVPWGYYFRMPNTTITATANGQPADVFDAYGGDEFTNIYVGAYVSASHPWTDWETVIEPRALEDGLERRVCGVNDSHFEERSLPATGVSGTLMAQMKSKAKNKLNISWTKIEGAEGYDIFFAKCNSKESKSKCKLVKSIDGNSTFEWNKGKLKKNTAYKVFVKAFAYKGGKKNYVGKSPTVHAYTTGGSKTYTNPKNVTVDTTSVSLHPGETFKIKGKVTKLNSKKKLPSKNHGKTLRYLSSDKSIATVTSSGKITAISYGECTVYVYAVNGVRKAITVTIE